MDMEKIRELIKLAKEEDLKVLRIADMDTEVHIETKGGDPVVAERGDKKRHGLCGRRTGRTAYSESDADRHVLYA